MFSVPSIWRPTAAERNDQRMAAMQSKLADAQARMRHAANLLNAFAEEGFSDMDAEQMAKLDIGNVQSIGQFAGSSLSAVMRATGQAEEVMLEALVLAGGFEPVQ